MPGPLQADMDMSDLGAMQLRQRVPDAVAVARGQDQVDVVGHEHPGPDAHLRRTAMLGQEVPIERVVGVAEERLRAPVAALRDVMGVPEMTTRANRAMARAWSWRRSLSNECTVTIIPTLVATKARKCYLACYK